MADPQGPAPWSADARDSVLAGRTHCNVAMTLYDVRDRLTPDQTGAAGDLAFDEVYLAAYYYLARCRHLPEEMREWNVNATRFLFDVVHAVRPELVPEHLRDLHEGDPRGVAPVYEIVHAVGVALFLASVEDGHEEGITASTGCLLWAREKAEGTPSEPYITFNLGSAVLAMAGAADEPHKYRRAGIDHMRRALASLPDGDPARAGMLAGLRRALAEEPPSVHPDDSPEAEVTAYMRDGGREPLDRAVEMLRAAVEEPRTEEPHRSRRRAELGQALRMRFELTGEIADLDASIAVLETVLANKALDDETLAATSSFLGLARLDRHHTFEQAADLEAAAEAVHHPAVARAAASPHHAQRLTNRAAVLTTRFRSHHDLADITQAIDDLTFAVSATPPSQHDHPVMAIKLAVALFARGTHTEEPGDLHAAERLLRPLAGEPSDAGPNQLMARLELGHVLQARARMLGGVEDLADAVDQYEATALAPAQDIRSRLHCAALWGVGAAELGDLERSRTAFDLALSDLVPKLTGRALGRESQEARLRELPYLATVAATVSVRAQEVREALVRLEQGRGVLLAQALELRGRHDELTVAAPGLADRFERVCAELVASHRSPQQRRQSAGDFDALVAEIRALTGFEDFQRPPAWEKLREAAAQGPVVVISVSPQACFALLLTPAADGTGTLEHLPLRVTADDITARAETFRTAVAALVDRATPGPERYRQDRAMKDTLRWLGAHIAGPVLDRLGLSRNPLPGEPLPRLWWCPTGALSLLPLHAALLDRADRADHAEVYVQDRVVSSYVPTLGSLLHARSRPAPGPDRASLLTVAVDAAGRAYPRLAALDDELAAVGAMPGRRQQLRDTAATPDAVLAALRTHTHAHLACHGVRDPGDPSRSRLLLSGGELTLRELAAERLPDAEFAYLSACHSAAAGEELADEVISVASAFQLCGYRHVIGSLWTVQDDMGPLLAREVYRNLGAPDGPGPAYALHRAVAALRAHGHYDDPLFWASVIHSGP
ncbi:CHAT domain-containing protein [Streptomyces sp. NPDC059104]|uniref:CHAT domain-containing protein n=1 Tax=Streptomyces sp. NPDC059104 TaxID=3346729 RepID=UPI00367A4F49